MPKPVQGAAKTAVLLKLRQCLIRADIAHPGNACICTQLFIQAFQRGVFHPLVQIEADARLGIPVFTQLLQVVQRHQQQRWQGQGNGDHEGGQQGLPRLLHQTADCRQQ